MTNVKTTSIMLQTLAVPCACRCRYCLLAWDGKTAGCELERAKVYAKAFHEWLKSNAPEISFNFCFGYSMDHPDLMAAIDFMNSIGSVSGRFLQLNGLKQRSPAEADTLMRELRSHGVESVNFTFYGTQDAHDRFAGRKGDFDINLTLARAAMRAGLKVSSGIALTKTNCAETDELRAVLKDCGIPDIRLFIPHEEGRGITLADVRCTVDDLSLLSPDSLKLLNRNIYRTEAEWLAASDIHSESRRSLLISLTDENIGRFEKLGFEAVIKYVEQLDEAYYKTVPGFFELLARYADASGRKLYGKRDIYQHCQKFYLRENKIDIYDVTDERYCGSRRY